MFNRERHNAILDLLQSFNSDFLLKANCYFGGGTAISLALDEFRESVDIDFICSDDEGYRLLRSTTVSDNLGELLNKPVKYLEDVRTNKYKINTALESNGIAVKVEIVREGRINISGEYNKELQVPVLSKEDLFAQKLLANADRGLDRASMSRDIIDLAVMIDKWGEIPIASWYKAVEAYGKTIPDYFAKSILLIHDEKHLKKCLTTMAIDDSWLDKIPNTLLNSILNLKERGISFAHSAEANELLEKLFPFKFALTNNKTGSQVGINTNDDVLKHFEQYDKDNQIAKWRESGLIETKTQFHYLDDENPERVASVLNHEFKTDIKVEPYLPKQAQDVLSAELEP